MQTPMAEMQASSEIYRSSSILLIRLERVEFTPWVKEKDGPLMTREGTLSTVVDQVLKGAVSQPVGKTFSLRIQQRGGGRVVMDYYGLWSHVPVAPGARFVAFCHGETRDAAVLLSDDHCEELLNAESALADTKAALELESRDLSADQILSEAESQGALRGGVFARYIWARVMADVMASETVFRALVRLMESGAVNGVARETYLRSLYEQTMMTHPPSRTRQIAMIRSMFRLLSIPEAQALHTAIREIYLQNLLHLDRKVARYAASEVFQESEKEQKAALAALQVHHDAPSHRLIDWLLGKTAAEPVAHTREN